MPFYLFSSTDSLIRLQIFHKRSLKSLTFKFSTISLLHTFRLPILLYFILLYATLYIPFFLSSQLETSSWKVMKKKQNIIYAPWSCDLKEKLLSLYDCFKLIIDFQLRMLEIIGFLLGLLL